MKEIEVIYRAFGAKIQAMREMIGWSQQELANKINLTRTSITNIEMGRQRILLHDIEKFANAFGSSPKHLLKGIWF